MKTLIFLLALTFYGCTGGVVINNAQEVKEPEVLDIPETPKEPPIETCELSSKDIFYLVQDLKDTFLEEKPESVDVETFVQWVAQYDPEEK